MFPLGTELETPTSSLQQESCCTKHFQDGCHLTQWVFGFPLDGWLIMCLLSNACTWSVFPVFVRLECFPSISRFIFSLSLLLISVLLTSVLFLSYSLYPSFHRAQMFVFQIKPYVMFLFAGSLIMDSRHVKWDCVYKCWASYLTHIKRITSLNHFGFDVTTVADDTTTTVKSIPKILPLDYL